MKYLINLFPEKKKNATDKIIYFSFHYLRYILVITQFVAICVFFYRFKVDQDIVDLRDALIQKKAIVEATKSLLDEVETIDKKMKNVKSILGKQKTTQDLYGYIFSQVPQNISIDKLSIDVNAVELEGTSIEINVIKDFVEKIKTEKRFKTVDLSSVNKTTQGYTFKLTLNSFK